MREMGSEAGHPNPHTGSMLVHNPQGEVESEVG